MKMGTKLYVYIGGITLVAFLVFGYFINDYVSEIINTTYQESIQEYLEDYTQLINMEVESKLKSTKLAVNMADYYIKDLGQIQENINDVILVGTTAVPKWTVNGMQLQLNEELINNISGMGIHSVTIFQKTLKGYVRVNTNVVNENGEKAYGTILGFDNPIVQNIERGDTYFGKANVLNYRYLTAYKPIYINNEISGIISVGEPEVNYDKLSEYFKTKSYFGSGYPYIVSSDGIVTAHPKTTGIDISGYDYFKEITEKKNGVVDYVWEDREKTQYFNYLENIDSYITVGWYSEDYNAIFKTLKIVVTIATLIALFAILLTLFIIVRSVIRMLGANPSEVQVIANKVAEGDFDMEIEVKQGDDKSLLYSMKQMVIIIKKMVDDTTSLANSAVNGKLDHRADSSIFKGDYKELIEGINGTLDAVIGPLNLTAEYVDRISKGDIPPKIIDEYKGDYNEIKNNINQLIDSLNYFIDEMNTMSEEQKAGNTDSFINESKFSGVYKDMALGVNNSIKDQIDGTLKILETIKAYSENNFQHIMEELPGKRKIANDYLNRLRNDFVAMINEISQISDNTLEGNLKYRSDLNKFDGVYKNIIQGFNDSLDALVNPLNSTSQFLENVGKGEKLQKYDLDQFKGDFVAIMNNVNKVREFIQKIVDDQSSTAQRILDGNSKIRINEEQYPGFWRNIIIGFNSALDAALAPTEAALISLKAMAKGNMTVFVKGDFKGDHAILKDSINSTLQSLNSILNNVNIVVEEVKRGAMQVADSSQSLSQGATEQAASIEEITSSISEISGQTKKNAENAREANSLADLSKSSSEKGNSEMLQLSDAMKNINESSNNIAKIIKVIDEIAFQTNLLALNAAVEAARAGVHGQGFAVVAEEVRNLAARSAKAAKETAELIEGSIKTVEQGNELTEKTALALNEIIVHSTKVALIIEDIARSYNEQAEGIGQIQEGFFQIDKVVQQNTAGAEEGASAAEQLSSQSKNLENMLAQFKLLNSDRMITSGNQQKYLSSKKEESFDINMDDDDSFKDLDDLDLGKY